MLSLIDRVLLILQNAPSHTSNAYACHHKRRRQQQLKAQARRKTALRSTYSADLDDIAAELAGGSGGGAGAGSEQQPAAAEQQGGDGSPLAARAHSDLGLGQASSLPAPAPVLSAEAPAGPVAGPPDGSPTALTSLAATPPTPLTAPASLPSSPRRCSLDAGGAAALNGAAAAGAPAAAAAAHAASGAGAPQLAPKSKYAVLLLDSADAAARLAALLARKGRALAAALAAALGAGHAGAVGIGVAAPSGLGETLRLLAAAGLSPRDVDFAVTDCGARIWYGGAAAAAAASGGAGAAALPEAAACAADEAYEAFVDHMWDRTSVRRVLALALAQRGLLTGLSGGKGAGAGAAGAAAPPLRVTADTETGPHRVSLTLRRKDEAAAWLRRPALEASAQLALVARVKRRLRATGLRAQVVAQSEADGSVRLHVTPLRASRALALRYLAQRHGVAVSDLVFVACARGPVADPTAAATAAADAAAAAAATSAAPAEPAHAARFAASDAEDLVGGVQSVLVIAPPPANSADDAASDGGSDGGGGGVELSIGGGGGGGGGGGAGGQPSASQHELGGFAVDLAPYGATGRVKVVPLAAAPPGGFGFGGGGGM